MKAHYKIIFNTTLTASVTDMSRPCQIAELDLFLTLY
jgi:hypothetical protein